MALSRTAKTTVIEEVSAGIQDAAVMIIVENKGLSVAEVDNLRSKMRGSDAHYRVTKNRLAKIAIKDTPYEALSDKLKGPTALAWSTDPVAVAKCVVDFAKDNDRLEIIAGAFGEKPLDKDSIEALAKMPSLDQLRGKLIGLLQAPAQQILGVLQAPGGQVARVISAKASKE